MAWASGRLKAARVARVRALVWTGNLIGFLGIALLALLAGHHLFGAGQLGLTALRTAEAKAALPFGRAFVLGMLCNTLVCLAIWLSLSSRLPAHRAILTVLPIAAFVAAGFEHTVANMYFIGSGLVVKHMASDAFWDMTHATPAMFPGLTSAGFAANLAAVTIGNIVGGAVLVAGVYWLFVSATGSAVGAGCRCRLRPGQEQRLVAVMPAAPSARVPVAANHARRWPSRSNCYKGTVIKTSGTSSTAPTDAWYGAQ